MIFKVPGVENQTNKLIENSIQQQLARKSGLGGPWGRFMSHSEVILGPKIVPEGGPETSWILGRF